LCRLAFLMTAPLTLTGVNSATGVTLPDLPTENETDSKVVSAPVEANLKASIPRG
jgi:hypothetical protein